MKKLLIALAAGAAAIGTYANDAIGGAGFDANDASPLTWKAGVGFDADFWSGTAGTMTLTKGDCGKLDDARPTGYAVTKTDYMALKTTLGSPVTQNVLKNGSGQLIGGGFYYDGLVKFTAFDETPDLDAAGYDGKKIAIFPMLESDADDAPTNIWICAAGSAGSTNLWKTATKIDGEWHRVTIKMIANVNKTGATAKPGFVVFIDGNVVTCTAAMTPVFGDGSDLTLAAKEFYNDSALFGSLETTATIAEVTGVLYDGQGAIDEVGFTDVAPFDAAKDSEFITIACGTDITGFTATYNSASKKSTGDVVDFKWVNGLNAEISAITCKEGMFCTNYTLTVTGAGDYTVSGAQTTGAYVTIGGGDPVAVKDLAAAVALVNEKGAGSISLSNAEGETIDEGFAVSNDLVIDLNGKTITYTGKDALFTVAVGKKLTIKDSGTDGEIVVTDAAAVIASSEDDGSHLVVESGKMSGTIAPYGWANAGIQGGMFKESEEDEEVFYLADYVAEGFKAGKKDANGYWPIVASITVSFNDGVNCTVTAVNGDTYTAGDEIKVEPTETLKVTYTAATGYQYGEGVDASGTTVVTVVAGEAESFKIPEPAAPVAKIDTAKYTTLSAAAAAAKAGDTIVVTADNYSYSDTIGFYNKDNLAGNPIVLDLNGKTVTKTGSGYAINAMANVKLTSLVAGGKFVRSGSGTLFLVGSARTEDDHGGAVATGKFEISDIEVENNTKNTIVKIENGEATVEGATLDAKGETGTAVAQIGESTGETKVRTNNAKLTIKSGTITGRIFSDAAAPEGTTYTLDVQGGAFSVDPSADGYTYTLVLPEGKKFEKNADNMYVLVDAAQPQPPEEPIVKPEGKTIKQFVEEVNQNKAKYLKAPYGETTKAYLDLFEAVPNGDNSGVTMELTEKAEEQLEALADTAAATALDGDTLTIAEPVAGFYYSLNEGATLEGMKTLEANANKTAGGDAITFTPDKTGNAGFWKVLVTTKAVTPDVAD